MGAVLAPEMDSHTGWMGHKDHCLQLIDEYRTKRVCEIGGGRAPLITLEEVAARELDYTVLDVSASELALAPSGYQKVCVDICGDVTALGERFDFMFSKMVAEHVPDGETMHRNVYQLLRPGGIAFHFFPTLYSPAFVVNRLLPQRLSHWLIERSRMRDEPKFPARYSRCLGPTDGMRRFYENLGYEVLEYRPFYGTPYFRRIPLLRTLDGRFTAWAARRRNPYLTSFVYVVVRKPGPILVDAS